MRAALILVIVLSFTACGRPLTVNERSFLSGVHGSSLDTGRVRVVRNGLIGLSSREVAARPQTTCRERIEPPPEGDTIRLRAAGMVAFSTVFARPDWAPPDLMARYPEELDLVAAMYLVHEMTHVWQWQNRHLTGYHPLKGAAEHKPGVDPYLFDPGENPRFLDFDYEQQASLVEEFVCCRALDPDGARTQRLAQLLAPVMDVAPRQTPIPVRIPWAGAEVAGICS